MMFAPKKLALEVIKDRKLGYAVKAFESSGGGCSAYLPDGSIALCKDYEVVKDHSIIPDNVSVNIREMLEVHKRINDRIDSMQKI